MNNSFKKHVLAFLLVVLFAFVTACPPDPGNDAPDNPEPYVPTVIIQEKAQTIGDDEILTLTTYVNDSANHTITYSWAINGTVQTGVTGTSFDFSSANEGEYVIKVTVVCGEESDTDTVIITVKHFLQFTKTASYTAGTEIINDAYYAVYVQGTNIITGTQSSGVVYSANSGTNWSVLNNSDDSLGSDQVYCVAVDSVDANRWYFGTFSGLSVYDDSPTPAMSTHEPSKSIDDIVLNGSTIYMATGSGVAEAATGSLNSFTYYDSSSNGLPADSINALYLDGSTLYAATGSGLAYAPTSDLSSWTIFSGSDSPGSYDVYDVYVDGDTIVAWTASYIHVSRDGGTNWTAEYGSVGTMKSAVRLGDYLYYVRYGSNLFAVDLTAAEWNEQEIELPDAPYWFGYNNNGICSDGSSLYIAHNKGLLKGTVE